MKKFLLKNKFLLCISVIITIIESIFTIGLAFILSAIINSAVNKNLDTLKLYLMIAVIYIFFQLLIGILGNYTKGIYTGKVESEYRNKVFESIIKKSPKEFFKRKEGDYLSILTNNIDDVLDSYVYSIFTIISTVTSGILTVISIIIIDYRILFVAIIVGIIYSLITKKISSGLKEYKDECYDSMSNFIVRIKELIGGYEVIKKGNITDKALSSYKKSSDKFVDKKVKFTFNFSNVNLFNLILGQGLVITIIGIVAYLVFKENLTIGDLVAVAQLMASLIGPLGDLNEIINSRASSENLLKKQLDIIENEEVVEKKGILKNTFKNSIEIEDLSFEIGTKKILEKISLKFEKNKKYAIVGESGSGKTTLFKLICNLLEAKSGKIFTKETPTLALSAKQLYDNLTCYENLDFFSKIYKNHLTPDDIKKILVSVNLSDKKDELTKNLSTGMKQRLNIAKTIATGKNIVVLDEPSSGLDPVNQIEISNLIKKYQKIKLYY